VPLDRPQALNTNQAHHAYAEGSADLVSKSAAFRLTEKEPQSYKTSLRYPAHRGRAQKAVSECRSQRRSKKTPNEVSARSSHVIAQAASQDVNRPRLDLLNGPPSPCAAAQARGRE
jgi:hypothetical protein